MESRINNFAEELKELCLKHEIMINASNRNPNWMSISFLGGNRSDEFEMLILGDFYPWSGKKSVEITIRAFKFTKV